MRRAYAGEWHAGSSMQDAVKDSKALAVPCSAAAHLLCNEACGHADLALPEVVQDMFCACPVPHHKGCSLHSHRPMICTMLQAEISGCKQTSLSDINGDAIGGRYAASK